MHPILFRIGSITIHTYGVMLAIAFLVGLWLSLRRGKKTGVDKNAIYDSIVIAVLASVVGSRFFYVIYHTAEFKGRWTEAFLPFGSGGSFGFAGLSMMGGVILTILSIAIFAYIRRVNILALMDTIAPAFLLGAGVARWGCFFNGCCYGVPTSGPLGLVFPEGSPAGYTFPNMPIFPTQLFASVLGFVMFGVSLILDRYRRFAGYTTAVVIILYSIDRIFVDFFRYYEPNSIIFRIGEANFSVNGLLLLILSILAGLYLMIAYIRAKR